MIKQILAAAVVLTALAPAAQAINYNQNITAIFGTGNPNTGWTTDSGDAGLVLGLRGKLRNGGSTANVNGVYSFSKGHEGATTKALWNWEFSLNSGSAPLTDYDFYVGIDTDPSAGISYTLVSFVNALSYWGDNEYGTSTTANGRGAYPGEAVAPGNANGPFSPFTAIGDYTIAQQSQNLAFVGGNADINGIYTYELFAVTHGATDLSAANRLADVSITVVTTPDAGSTLGLLGLGLVGMAGFNYRKRAKAA